MGAQLSLEYATDLFHDDSMDRLLENYQQLLLSAVATPLAALGSLVALPPQRLDELAMFSAGPQRDEFMLTPLVHTLFEQQAASNPARDCLIFEGSNLSYGEVNAAANALAWRLVDLGVQRGVPVGIVMDRSLELVVAILAVLKAGGIYLPLEPSFPADRLAMYASEAKPAVLLSQRRRATVAEVAAAGTGCSVLFVDDAPPAGGRADNLPADRAARDDTAYVIFTSGSTGRPKGIAVQHQSIAEFVAFYTDFLEAGEHRPAGALQSQFQPCCACPGHAGRHDCVACMLSRLPS